MLLLLPAAWASSSADGPAAARSAQPEVETLIARPWAAAGATLPLHLLTSIRSPRLIVEVDRVAGATPDRGALAEMIAVLREVCDVDRRVRLVEDDVIPREEWLAATEDDPDPWQLAARYVDAGPTAQADRIYLLYLPRGKPWFSPSVTGYQATLRLPAARRGATLPALLIFREALDRKSRLRVSGQEAETAVLVHELGHALGLVADSRRAQAGRPGHCGSARCVMHQPGLRAALVTGWPALATGRVPTEFCRRCRDELRRRRTRWSSQD